MKICSLPGCITKYHSRTYCKKHYRRFMTHGDPLCAKKPLKQRFEDKVELIPFSTCHWWTGAINTRGYGAFNTDHKTIAAHRVSYELYIGDIPDGLFVCHKCDNRLCVNPDHLFVGTNQDNMDDMYKKKRNNQPKGVNHCCAKMTEEDVLRIRLLAQNESYSISALADKYELNSGSIWQIVHRKTWKHI